MAHQALREFIELALAEDIRSAPGFNIDVMKKFKTVPEIYNYVKKYLKPMGRGSSRMTYLLSSRKILKIAKNDAGLSQNEAEVDVFTSPSTKNVVARIFDYDPQNKWLVSELVKPLSEGEFHRLTGWSFVNFGDALVYAIKQPDLLKDKNIPPNQKEFFERAVSAIKSGGLELSDLRVAEHWGKTPDGRVVLLDYGYTADVYSKHYAGDYPSNFAGISRTPGAKGDDTGDIDWGDTFL